MPLLSAFTPCGLLRLSSQPSEAEKIYRALLGSLGGNYDVSPGSRMEAWCYAWARTLGLARLTLIHAGLQISPPCVTEMMGLREDEWQIIPGPDDSLDTRRRVLAARELLPRGARREAVEDALRTLLGDAFVWYYTTKPADISTWPAAVGDQPMNLQLPEVERKRIIVTQPITTGLGSPQAVTYTLFDATTPALLVGNHVVVNPEILQRTEVVSVTAVTGSTFTATFNNPHDANCVGTTAPWPMQTSNQRFNLIVLEPAAALDPEVRRKINDLLERVLRAPSTWAIGQETSPGVAGPYLLDASPLDATPFGVVSFP